MSGPSAGVLPLASYKLRFADEHVRAVPATDGRGCPFAGPGVDLRGDAARQVLRAAGNIRAWLEAREAGVVLRSLSFDRRALRFLVTLESPAPSRPRVLRFDAPYASELAALATELEERLGAACAEALERRATRGG